MLTNPLPRQRKNTVNKPLTPAAAAWLLAEYDATDPGEVAERSRNEDRSVVVQPIFTLKSIYEPGDSMRVTASDYGDNGRWWL
jgi:hypothetical protein